MRAEGEGEANHQLVQSDTRKRASEMIDEDARYDE